MTQEKAQHTPGPWDSYPDPDTECSTLIEGRDGEIATVWNTCENDDCAANARLIAAAPDLLAALIDVHAKLDSLNWTTPEINQILEAARAAIAKATD